MAPPIYFPGRIFTVWKYTISHRQLIPRSVKDKERGISTRIDILFKPVAWMSLPTGLSDLSIEATSPEQVELMTTISDVTLQDPEKLFVLRGRKSQGYVAASLYAIDESTREFDEPDKWGNLSFFAPEHDERTSEEWRQLGYSSGARLRKAPPDTDEIFLHQIIKDCLLGLKSHVDPESIDAFIEGMKAGYTQRTKPLTHFRLTKLFSWLRHCKETMAQLRSFHTLSGSLSIA
ncbi:hypothetical protein KSD_84080 [Ktedonobacter sp. SOSP1-85]|uniref:hypothetical protein n=1 Tax=Ktedonobacter sp. SOSP1-85 TaxID=2778367 RepID=UPI0019152EE9|nr:hypothetical protein [Ktedonobacter sp. SOSP1-85]GHO80637.1 hypothetical protein KSD_84080 [Ktedonobacter sp. SOSP1-85]